ncbi:MAG: ABC transporter ATP-binding protein, partial [Candidatus Electrothrix sp. AR4]|nr:ABC transporter ATP-binding protein [Candidatus Electrothrix sp. AR4]
TDVEAPVLRTVEKILQQVRVRKQQRSNVRKALLQEYLATARIEGCWLLRLSPSASFIRQLRRAKFPRSLIGLVGATLGARLLILGASFLVGKTIFQGNADPSDFQLWGLLLFTALPLQLTSMQLKNRLSLHFGTLLRSRLLHGILQLRPEEIQHQGSGYFIGNIQEIEQLEAMGMSSAFMALTASLEVVMAAAVLILGAGGILHGALLLVWTGGILLLSRIYYQRMRDWLIHSRMMTCDLVERMVGHRTRLTQEKTEHLHDREDQLLSRYAHLSERLDTMEVIMKSAAGRRGWLPVSLLGTLTLFFNTGTSATQLAVSLGGTLLAALALDQLVQSIYQLLKTIMSWQQVFPLYQAASRERAKKTPHFLAPTCFKQHG